MSDRATRRRTHRRGLRRHRRCSSPIALVAAMAFGRGRAGPEARAGGPVRRVSAPRRRRTRRNCGPDGKLAYPYPQRAPVHPSAEEGREQRRRDVDGRHEGHDQDRAVPRHARRSRTRSEPRPAVGTADRPCDGPAGVLRGLVPRLERGARAQLQHCGAASSSAWSSTRPAPTRRRSAPTRSTSPRRSRSRWSSTCPSRPGRRPGVRGRARGEEDHRVLRRHHQRGSRPAGAVPLARRLRQQRRPRSTRAQFAARQLQGETAKWSGDFTDKKRVFGAIHPDTRHRLGVLREHREEGRPEGRRERRRHYRCRSTRASQSAKHQEEAPVLVAKLKDAGVTTVLLFTPFHDEPGGAQGRRPPRLPPRVGVHRLWARRTSRSRRGS